MQVKITRNAAKMIKLELDKPESEGKKLRVFITHAHGDHAHYGMGIDVPSDKDVVVTTDKEIDVILEQGLDLLDGIRIDYFYTPEEGFVITNPSKNNHGDH